MKCELCHKKEAETVLNLQKEGREIELYVCKTCAKKARAKTSLEADEHVGTDHLPKNGETDFPGNLPDVLSLGDELTNKVASAMDDLFTHIKDATEHGMPLDEALTSALKRNVRSNADFMAQTQHFPLKGFPATYVVRDCLHLEGLFQIYELQDVLRACSIQDVYLVPYDADGFSAAGHLYEVRYSCPKEELKDCIELVIEREKRARSLLVTESSRVFADSLGRALAILKVCRILTQGEFVDLMSPVRVALCERLLKGIKLAELDHLIERCDLEKHNLFITEEEANRMDDLLADEANSLFRGVNYTTRAMRIFL